MKNTSYNRDKGPAGLLLVIFLGVYLAGCSSEPTRKVNAQMPYPPTRAPVEGDILHMRTGYFVSEEAMLNTVTDARIVYVGEAHNNIASHRLQLKVMEAMEERWSGQVALGMEMFIPEQQEALDRWIAGDLTETEFLEQSRWKERWSINFDYYRDLLLFAREKSIPVIALNVPKSLVRAVAQKDFSELPDEERRKIPDMERNTPYRDELTRAFYGGHAKSDSGLEGFRRVQALWDESMAENAVRFLNSPAGEDRRLLIVAGGNHIRYGVGIPRAVFRRLPVSYVLVGTRILVIEEKDRGEIMNVDLPEFPMTPFDYIAFVKYERLEEPETGADETGD